MNFRTRVALASSAAVAVAVLLVSWSAYLFTQRELVNQIDTSLDERASQASSALREAGPAPGERLLARHLFPTIVEAFNRPRGNFDTWYGQVLSLDGTITSIGEFGPILPVDGSASLVRQGSATRAFESVWAEGEHVRMISIAVPSGAVLQFARSLTETDETLSALANRLALAGAVGLGLAGAAGVAVASRATRPIAELSAAAEHVASTNDLDARLTVSGNDELAQLATRFNEMLAALKSSKAVQHQLVRDASHELRTPLTALRMNADLLDRAPDIDADTRRQIVSEMSTEIQELTVLVTELVDTATDSRDEIAFTDVSLAEVAETAAADARRRSHRTIVVTADDSVVHGIRIELGRAIANLVQNATKWSGAKTDIHIEVAAGVVTVIDEGTGVRAEELEKIFDRFYRTAEARQTAGSGLGLSIVKRIAEDHDGAVHAASTFGVGSRIGFSVPTKVPEG